MYYVLLTLGLLVASLTCIGNLWMFAIVLPIFGYLYAYPTISRKSKQKSTEQTRDEIKNATTSITKMQVHRQMLQEKADAIKQDQKNWANRRKSIENDIVALQHQKESLQREIFELNRDLTNIQSEITEYINSMYRAEIKSINYMKRLDDKEYALLEEIRRDGDIMKKYGDIQIADGYAFEEYVAGILRGNGYENVEVTKKSGDYGADITAVKDAVTYVFQCKYYTEPVGVQAIQEVFSSKTMYRAHVAVVVTNSIFTIAARTLAENTGVILFDGEKLDQLKKKSDVVTA